MSDQTDCGWVKLYTNRGAHVTVPVTVERRDYAAMLANVHAMLDAGFQIEAPGLEEGEEREMVGWVLKGEFERDNETTQFVCLYADSDQLTWSFLKIYLNKPADVEAFEFASKMKLASLPLYVGNDKPQRGAAQKTDKFILRAPKPFGVVFKKNPKHDNTEEGKMKPARLFVRWADQKTGDTPTAEGKPSSDTPTDTKRLSADIESKMSETEKQLYYTVRTSVESKINQATSLMDLDAIKEERRKAVAEATTPEAKKLAETVNAVTRAVWTARAKVIQGEHLPI